MAKVKPFKLEVLVVNENRYIINTGSPFVDQVCEEIISSYPSEPVIDFDIPRDEDLDKILPPDIHEYIMNSNERND